MHRISARSVTVATVLAGMLLVSLIPVTLSQTAFAQKSVAINGAGATFPFPLIDTWRVEYKKVNPSVSLNYQSIGSGGGIRQFTEKTVDFGATDAPLNQAQRGALPSPAVHIPETIGSVVAAYNVPGVESGLKLTGTILADIYLGKITVWNDPAIVALNPGLPLPSKPILVVERSDGSGTTFVWTSYLSSVSPAWQEKVGKGTAVQWPTGRGAPGNEGVATTVAGAKFSIGYVELSYALTTGMDYAYIQNQAGNFIEPTLESTRAAVTAAAGTLPTGEESWEAVSLVNAAGADSYPIASFSYLLLYKEMSTSPKIDSLEKTKAIVDLVAWAISSEGQEHAKKLSYVPLPDSVVALNQKTLASLTYEGKAVYGAPGSSAPSAGATASAEEEETPTADLKVTASGKKTSKLANIKVKNTAGSDIHSFTVELAVDAKSARAPAGWTSEMNEGTVTFSTETKPIKTGKTVTFRVTGSSAVAGFDWSAADAGGSVLADGAVTRR
jgi:phosphate transport system permease protein/phosphate transport system substrate-binding protein